MWIINGGKLLIFLNSLLLVCSWNWACRVSRASWEWKESTESWSLRPGALWERRTLYRWRRAPVIVQRLILNGKYTLFSFVSSVLSGILVYFWGIVRVYRPHFSPFWRFFFLLLLHSSCLKKKKTMCRKWGNTRADGCHLNSLFLWSGFWRLNSAFLWVLPTPTGASSCLLHYIFLIKSALDPPSSDRQL